ncbi:MAG: carotenoid biosynthesis protein [Nitrososphaerales archaeon]
MNKESKLGSRVVHLLLLLFAITLAYVVFGLIANYQPSADIFFALSFALLFFVLGQSIYEIGIRNAIVFLAITTVVGFLFEVLGTSTGLPFGKYYYGNFLGTMVLNVPIVVPLTWFVIVYLAFSMCFSHFGEKKTLEPWGRVVAFAGVAAFGAVAWDFMVDPMFSSYGYWIWENNGSVPTLSGVPLSNFVGWFVVALLMILSFVFVTRKKKVILRRNVLDSRIAYILLLIDGTVANGDLGHYLVIGVGVVAMLAFLVASHLASSSDKERIMRQSSVEQYPKEGS